jgi:superfamily II DNA or RNA helicase
VDVSGLRRTAGDYNHGDLEQLMAKPSVTGNAIVEYNRLAPGRMALAFCVTVAHAEAVAKAFSEAGIPSESVDGKLSAEERAARLARLASGETRVLTSCELISEGFDAPAVGAVISLRPTQSLTLHMQQIGRGLRPSGERDCIVLDHAGNCFRHGFAEDDRVWSLEGRPRNSSTEPVIEVHRCLECFACYQGGVCPQCGAGRQPSPREVKQREGEMERLLVVQKRVGLKTAMQNARSYEDFQAIGIANGYNPKWAGVQWGRSWQRKYMNRRKAAA